MLKIKLLKIVKRYNKEFYNSLNSDEHGFIIKILDNNDAELSYIYKNEYKLFFLHVSTVDIEIFSKINKNSFFYDKFIEYNDKYIPYVGNINFKFINIDLLFIFKDLFNKNKSVKLLVIGLNELSIIYEALITTIEGRDNFFINFSIYESRES